ncbi:hypothetical protein GCM10017608_03810 [Agromyces luteolus]|nr:hypothetical protein GCM10017608_03810 [Agromyces luteolus]
MPLRPSRFANLSGTTFHVKRLRAPRTIGSDATRARMRRPFTPHVQPILPGTDHHPDHVPPEVDGERSRYGSRGAGRGRARDVSVQSAGGRRPAWLPWRTPRTLGARD